MTAVDYLLTDVDKLTNMMINWTSATITFIVSINTRQTGFTTLSDAVCWFDGRGSALTSLNSVRDNNGVFSVRAKEDFKRERNRGRLLCIKYISTSALTQQSLTSPFYSAHAQLSCTYGIWLRWYNERTRHDGKYPLHVDPRWPPAGGGASVWYLGMNTRFQAFTRNRLGRRSVAKPDTICNITPSLSASRGGQSSSVSPPQDTPALFITAASSLLMQCFLIRPDCRQTIFESKHNFKFCSFANSWERISPLYL